MVQVYQQAKKLIKKDWKKTSVIKMYEEIQQQKKKKKKKKNDKGTQKDNIERA